MRWNWELNDWPKFFYDPDLILLQERKFFLGVGGMSAYLKSVGTEEFHQFIVEILSTEGLESSRIEGEILDRESLQSSIKQHFGLNTTQIRVDNKESKMAQLLCNVYETFNMEFTHDMLCQWQGKLFDNRSNIEDLGKYRTHNEPMQIVSNRYDIPKIFFEAPPSKKVPDEMEMFLNWFNSTRKIHSVLGRAAMAHVYFESIHPFEDGNGRIGRLLVEKILSQEASRPVLIAVSKVLERRKKEYYQALERCNRTLNINDFVTFFSDVILQAQEESIKFLCFLIAKSKIMREITQKINSRQEKVLLMMFSEGLTGVKAGLSAENYIAIAKTSRATATRDLAELVQMKALIKNGELRYTRYMLNIAF